MKYSFLLLLVCFFSCQSIDPEIKSLVKPYDYVEDLNYYLSENFRLQLSTIKKEKLFIIPVSSCTPCVDDVLNRLSNQSCGSCAILFVGENQDSLRQVKIDHIKESTKTYFDTQADLYNYATNIGKPSVLFIKQEGIDYMILDINEKSKTSKILGW